MRYTIAVNSALRPFMVVIGITSAEKRFVELTEDGLEMRYGWWSDRLTYAELAAVEPRGWRHLYGYGMRIAPEGTLGLVGTSKGVVAVKLREEHAFKVPFTMKFKQIAISLEKPEGFMDALRERL